MKGFSPYEWFDYLDKPNSTALPSHQQFYSNLKNSNITEEEYAYCQHIERRADDYHERLPSVV